MSTAGESLENLTRRRYPSRQLAPCPAQPLIAKPYWSGRGRLAHEERQLLRAHVRLFEPATGLVAPAFEAGLGVFILFNDAEGT